MSGGVGQPADDIDEGEARLEASDIAVGIPDDEVRVVRPQVVGVDRHGDDVDLAEKIGGRRKSSRLNTGMCSGPAMKGSKDCHRSEAARSGM